MNEEKAIALIKKYKQGNLTKSEEGRLYEWYLLQAAESRAELSPEEMEHTVELIRNRLPLSQPDSSIRLWRRIGTIAAAVFLCLSGIYFFAYYKSSNPAGDQAVVMDILPGKTGATLTLSNGKQISLAEAASGKIAEEAGLTVSKAPDGQIVYQAATDMDSGTDANAINTLSTAKGETYMLRLPDGSGIWLNSASSISYPLRLAHQNTRLVKISGEVYFEVAKDKKHPFVVESRGQRVEVLGTHFNVNGYENEDLTATTLVEGMVKVSSGKHSKIIRPGQQALTSKAGISLRQADLDNITDWKEGDFYLNHVEFKTAMRKISRWYDVEVIYEEDFPEDLETGGWISRNNKLSTVLKLIESSGQVHFRVQGRKVFVSK